MAFQHVVRPKAGAGWPRSYLHFDDYGEPMAKPNYHQARKQKEVARKARQQEKQQRRAAKPNDAAAATESATPPELSSHRDAGSGNPT